MGVAGDMLFGALLELHPNKDDFIDRFKRLNIPHVEVSAQKRETCGIVGTHVSVKVDGVEEHSHDHHHDHEHHHDHDHDHHHGHTHSHHSMKDVEDIINGLGLTTAVTNKVLTVYKEIAKAESTVHGKELSEIHFHEVGMMDAIADVTGVCMLFDEIGADRVVVSPVNTGFGKVHCAHGILPVPAPATALLLKGIPVYAGEFEGELTTPTGAALIRIFADEFGNQPQMAIDSIGYGLGTKEFGAANAVRAILGEDMSGISKEKVKALLSSALHDEKRLHPVPFRKGEVALKVDAPARSQKGEVGDTKDYPSSEYEDVIVEFRSCIDDMTAEEIGYATELLMDEGALDVYVTPIGMKKNRPGILLTILAKKEDEIKFRNLIFKYTTTIGVRVCETKRYKLLRRESTWETPFGEIRVKESGGFGVKRRKLEYEDIKKIAESAGMSVGDIRDIIGTDGEEE